MKAPESKKLVVVTGKSVMFIDAEGDGRAWVEQEAHPSLDHSISGRWVDICYSHVLLLTLRTCGPIWRVWEEIKHDYPSGSS